MNPAMLQYLQQLYAQRGGQQNMPAQIQGMPISNQPLMPAGTQTNWMGAQTNWGPPQIADDSGMYGPTLATLAGNTGAPNMVNAPSNYMPGNRGPMPGNGMGWQPRSPMPTRPGGMAVSGNQGPMPNRQPGVMLGSPGPMPNGPRMTTGNQGVAHASNPVAQANNNRAMHGNQMQANRQAARQLRQLNRRSTGI